MTERVFQASGQTIRNMVVAVRKLAGVRREDTPEELRSGGEDGLWRVHLRGGIIIEATVVRSDVGEKTFVHEVQ